MQTVRPLGVASTLGALTITLVLVAPLFAVGCDSDSTPPSGTSRESGPDGGGAASGNVPDAGGGSSTADAAFWRKILAGDGATEVGGATSSKNWRFVARRAKGAVADTPCTEGVGNDSNPCPTTTFRSDGRSAPFGVGVTQTFTDTWTLDGATLSQTVEVAANTFKSVATLADEGTVDGKRRLRFNGVSSTDPTGTTDSTGTSTVYEEAP